MSRDDIGELAIGALAPDVRLPSNNDNEITLADYRDRAHVVMFFVRVYQ